MSAPTIKHELLQHEPPDVGRLDHGSVSQDGSRIKRELRTFITRQIEISKPDRIVVCDRKGTAIMRALIECSDQPLDWSWDKVVSTTALKEVPRATLQKEKLLVFDDMVGTGRLLNKVRNSLVEVFGSLEAVDSQVRFASFAVARECSRVNVDGRWPVDGWFYRELTEEAYREVRRRIVQMLQEQGSLMLDTEHIEVRVHLRGSLNRFLLALQRRARPVVFKSLGERTNITVYYGDDDAAHQLPEERFPKGTGFTHIVKKCRVVWRGPNEFAIIPICLPSVVDPAPPWLLQSRDAQLLGDSSQNQMARFYDVALLASFSPLEWILRDLYAFDPQAFDLSLPCRRQEVTARSGYSLDHLQVMYPKLNLDALVERVAEAARHGQSEGTKRRQSKRPEFKQQEISNHELHSRAIELLQLIRDELDRRLAEHALEPFHAGVDPLKGLRAREIFEIGKKQGWEPAIISTLFDILIDDANLVTRVENTQDERGNKRWTRTFNPDGEVVSNSIRRFTILNGLPRA